MGEHTHHFVPRPAGRTSTGEPRQELRCECGATPTSNAYPSNPSRNGHRGMR